MPLTSSVGLPLHEHLELGTIYGYGINNLFSIAVRNSGGAITNAAALGTASTHVDPKEELPESTIAKAMWSDSIDIETLPFSLLELLCTKCAVISASVPLLLSRDF